MTDNRTTPDTKECVKRLMAVVDALADEGQPDYLMIPCLTEVICMAAMKNPDIAAIRLEATTNTLTAFIDSMRTR